MSVARHRDLSDLAAGHRARPKTLRDVTAAWRKDQRVKLEGGRATEYQVNPQTTSVLKGYDCHHGYRRTGSPRADVTEPAWYAGHAHRSLPCRS
jgi:hypothetical protein